jgi:hypothetical protein
MELAGFHEIRIHLLEEIVEAPVELLFVGAHLAAILPLSVSGHRRFTRSLQAREIKVGDLQAANPSFKSGFLTLSSSGSRRGGETYSDGQDP